MLDNLKYIIIKYFDPGFCMYVAAGLFIIALVEIVTAKQAVNFAGFIFKYTVLFILVVVTCAIGAQLLRHSFYKQQQELHARLEEKTLDQCRRSFERMKGALIGKSRADFEQSFRRAIFVRLPVSGEQYFMKQCSVIHADAIFRPAEVPASKLDAYRFSCSTENKACGPEATDILIRLEGPLDAQNLLNGEGVLRPDLRQPLYYPLTFRKYAVTKYGVKSGRY